MGAILHHDPFTEIAGRLEHQDCSVEERLQAADLLRQQRQLILAMQDDATKAWYAADKDLRRDVMVNGVCPECGGTAYHTEGCLTGMRSVLEGFQRMNLLVREALGLMNGESLSVAIQDLRDGKRLPGMEAIGYLHGYGVDGLRRARESGEEKWCTPCQPSPVFGEDSVPVYVAKRGAK